MVLPLERVRHEYRISLKLVEDILEPAVGSIETAEGCAILNLLMVKYYEKLMQECHCAFFLRFAISKCKNASREQTQANLVHFRQFVSIYLTYRIIGHENLQVLEESQLADCTYMFIIKIFCRAITIIEQHKSLEAELKELLRSAALLYVASLEVQRPIPEVRLVEISSIADSIVTEYETYIKNLPKYSTLNDVVVYAAEDTVKYKELLRPGQQAA